MKSRIHAIIIGIVFTIAVLSCQANNNTDISKFIKDFEYSLKPDLSEEELNYLFEDYPTLLLPHSDVSVFMSNLEGNKVPIYPLEEFKSSSLYLDNIRKLLNSENPNHRILSYLVIAASGDKSFESELLKKITSETAEGNLIWSGMALLHLKTEHTTELFDYLVANEDFGDAHMLPLFIALNKDSLQETAYSRIESDNITARILAAQILSVTEPNDRSEQVLKNAVKEWDIGIKGYAIYSIKELKIGNLLEIMKPLLDSSQTKQIALEALSNSPTQEDQDFFRSLSQVSDTVSKEILNSYLQSSNLENVAEWLELIQTKQIPKKYYYSSTSQPLLKTDELLPNLQTALRTVSNVELLSKLVRLLEGRTDSISVDIMVDMLSHENSTVRYWTATALEGNTSKALADRIPDLLVDSIFRSTALIDLAIANNVDTFQTLFYSIYADPPDIHWKYSSIKYLSNFPLKVHKSIFVNLLEDENESDIRNRRNAALGLGRLKDKESVDLIIKYCRDKSLSYSNRPQEFLIALGMIKGDKAKKEIEKHRDSQNNAVKELVAEILNEW